MKNTLSIIAAAFAISLTHSAFAAGNYNCDTLNVISGQHNLGVGYNVVVGVDYETQRLDAMVFSRPIVPHPTVSEVTLNSPDGRQDATYFSNGTTSFAVSENESVGALSLDSGRSVFLCTQKPLTGAVTGHTN